MTTHDDQHHDQHEDQIGTVAEIMKDTRIAVLTYLAGDGSLVSTPMGTQDFEHPGTVWFLTERDTDKVRAIQADPRVNVAYASDEGWVSLTGTARVNEDREKLKQLWDLSAGAFMTGGPEDESNVLLEVTGTSAEYWDTPGKVTSVIEIAKGLVGRGTPDLGDNDTVAL
ncbi:pyridoxamine 5'-phosphate oxidase family protein [Nocardioides hwasunensis]|uniref:Pyridoxamine 5'-phosphate oxidase family protein n=1 Tax=Nocardioides hwasunensis TaxID=397258 RepID=A0ABR8ME79_9ACTN|nr:pyridoxamine 5'-phosphate oxidase family protein [Nocardioides hwasunensis]MBD3914420.1 pyridoxamine 5'-phosphate oxidase family protein [Nocardioides hwasunensis]